MAQPVRLLLPLLVCAFAAHSAYALPRIFMGMDGGRPARDRMFERIAGAAAGEPCPTYKEAWWPQPKDHADPSKGNWNQYYQINDKFFDWKKTDKPIVFLMLGGEGPIAKKWVCVENYVYMEMAKKYNALVIQLEHRFFEANATTSGWPDMKTATLKLLTTEQAMADAASFIDGYSKKNNFTNANWVGFGGSYPGTLAALLRVFYPNSTLGNIASSAPLFPKVDFYEYAQVMENTIRDTDNTCYENTRKAFQDTLAMTKTADQQKKLEDTFNITHGLGDWTKPLDVQNFFSNIFSALQGIIQYTYDNANNRTSTDLTIRYACDNFLNTKDASHIKLAKIYAFDTLAGGPSWNGKFNGDGDFSYDNGIAPLKETNVAGKQAAMRGWMWLCCNEFGWLQATDTGYDSIFGNVVPLTYQLKMCVDLFNDESANGAPFHEDDIFIRINQSKQKFGTPYTYNATNVVLPNGGYDPWHALGVNRTIEEIGQFTVFTPKAAHCSDMYPAYKAEPKGLDATRDMVRDQVHSWLLDAGAVDGKNEGKGAAGVGISSALLLLSVFLVRA